MSEHDDKNQNLRQKPASDFGFSSDSLAESHGSQSSKGPMVKNRSIRATAPEDAISQSFLSRQTAQMRPAKTTKKKENARWEALKKGLKTAYNLNDEAAPLALRLMSWYVTGFGSLYHSELDLPYSKVWNIYMCSAIEIRKGIQEKLSILSEKLMARCDGSGKVHRVFNGIKLNQMESMRLTLHGCESLSFTADYEISKDPQTGVEKCVFSNIHCIWNDHGDMHDAVTELEDGSEIHDDDFKAGGNAFPIQIHFRPENSSWIINNNYILNNSGWPGIPTKTLLIP